VFAVVVMMHRDFTLARSDFCGQSEILSSRLGKVVLAIVTPGIRSASLLAIGTDRYKVWVCLSIRR